MASAASVSGWPMPVLQQEPVELRLRQPVGAGLLDRVLGADHHERRADRPGDAVDGHRGLLHHLEQRRLGLRRGPVDLVGQHDGGEDRARVELERAHRLVVDGHAGDVGRQQVGGELDPRGAAVRCVAASALASVVLPVPGTSSSSRCPSESRQISDSRIASGLPTSARPMASTTAVNRSANWAASVGLQHRRAGSFQGLHAEVLYSQLGMVVRSGDAMAVARYHL